MRVARVAAPSSVLKMGRLRRREAAASAFGEAAECRAAMRGGRRRETSCSRERRAKVEASEEGSAALSRAVMASGGRGGEARPVGKWSMYVWRRRRVRH